ncbi:MAG: c-type cytochrome [Vicinamibacterales bacterium]
MRTTPMSKAGCAVVAWLAMAPTAMAADGLYTAAQAKRGREVYRRECAQCHRDDLNGRRTDGGPALRGNEFLKKWRGQSVTEILRPAEELMPAHHPGKAWSGPDAGPSSAQGRSSGTPASPLTRQTYIDVIAYILQQNGAPAGDQELPSDPALLKSVIVRFGPVR